MADNRFGVYTNTSLLRRKFARKMHTKRGFTLVELIIVIAIIAILATLAVLGVIRYQANSKLTRVTTELNTLATATTQYAEDHNYTYPADVSRGMPPGLEKYLPNQVWPTSVWPHGQFDYDAWPYNGQQVYQISYHLCGTGDPASTCADPILFPTFVSDSTVFYCISGPCIPHQDEPNIPGYCVNCTIKKVNY